MRLAEGIVVDVEKTLGELRFSAHRRDVFERDEDGNQTSVVKERTYDLKSKGQGQMIQVSIPASALPKDYDYNTEVTLLNPVFDTVAEADYRSVEVSWYIKADDIFPKNGVHNPLKSAGTEGNKAEKNK